MKSTNYFCRTLYKESYMSHDKIEDRVNKLEQEVSSINEKLDHILSVVFSNFSAIQTSFQSVSDNFDSIEGKFDSLEKKVDEVSNNVKTLDGTTSKGFNDVTFEFKKVNFLTGYSEQFDNKIKKEDIN